jgi:hypothetical protein
VINADAVSHYGVGALDAINAKKFQEGGEVEKTGAYTPDFGAAPNSPIPRETPDEKQERLWKLPESRTWLERLVAEGRIGKAGETPDEKQERLWKLPESRTWLERMVAEGRIGKAGETPDEKQERLWKLPENRTWLGACPSNRKSLNRGE